MNKSIFLSAMLLLVATVSFAQHPTRAQLQKQRAAIQKEINNVKRTLNNTTKNRKETIGQLVSIEKKVRLREAEINNINQQMSLIDNDINKSTRDVVKLRKELDTLKMQYEKSIVYAYKSRSSYDFINFLFSSTSFNDALKRVAYLRSYRKYREQQAADISNTQLQLKDRIVGLNDNRSKKKEILVDESKQRSLLEEEQREKNMVISRLRSREKELNIELAARKKQNLALNNAIAAAIRRARDEAAKDAMAEAKRKPFVMPKAAGKNNKTTAGRNDNSKKADLPDIKIKVPKIQPLPIPDPASQVLSEDFTKHKGNLPWPVESGTITSHFGIKPIPGTPLVGNNPGITIETDAGRSVKAIFDGKVVSVFTIGSFMAVIIKHGRYFTTYSNLNDPSVSRGQLVKRGQVIGKAGENTKGKGDVDFLISTEEAVNIDPEIWLRN